MAVVKPFRAVRYGERAGPLERLVAQPYDVIDPARRERYLAASPYNVVRLTLPDSERQAAADFAAWRREGILVRDEEPALWWLSQSFEGPDGVHRTRTGLVASVRVEPYSARVIRPHERTHAEPKEGRLRLLRAVRAQLEPIFLLYDDPDGAPRRALERFAAREPDLRAADDGVESRLWRVTDAHAIAEAEAALAELPLLIADGHHRYETALAFHDEDGSPGSALTLAVLVNTRGEGLTIFATHRVVASLPALDRVELADEPGGPLAALERVNMLSREHPAFAVYRAGRAAVATASFSNELDAAFLDRLGLGERTYTPHAGEAVALVDAGAAEGAFLLRPPTIEQVQAVAEAGETMPQKSTYFFPKLLSGLLFHPL